MHTAIVAGGSSGDVHPFLGVGRALRQRGHSVVCFAHSHYRQSVEAAGMQHEPIGEHIDFETVVRDPRLMDPRQGGRLILEMLAEGAPQLVNKLRADFQARRPDVVLRHHICLGVRWIGEELGLIQAVGTVSPIMWMSGHALVPPAQMRPGWIWEKLGRAATPAFRGFVGWYADRTLRKARAAAGFPLERHTFAKDTWQADKNLALWSEHFRPRCPDDPAKGIACGFTWHDKSGELPQLPGEIERFLAAGPPPVVFTLGTSSAYSPGVFFEAARAACGSLQVRALFITGLKETQTTLDHAGILTTGYVPFSKILPAARAVVHHGGIGTTALAIRAGCPAVIVPQAHDQFNNALMAIRHGTAVWLDRPKLSAVTLTAALKKILDDESYLRKTRDLGSRLAAEDGGLRAAIALEDMVASRRALPG